MARSRSSRTKKTSTKSPSSTGKKSQALTEENKKSRVGLSLKAVARAGLERQKQRCSRIGPGGVNCYMRLSVIWR